MFTACMELSIKFFRNIKMNSFMNSFLKTKKIIHTALFCVIKEVSFTEYGNIDIPTFLVIAT